MPNGRTAIFPLEKSRLLACVESLRNDETIGERFSSLSGSEDSVSVTVADWSQEVGAHSEAQILVEKQHHDFYIVHCGEDFKVWICVDKSSPLFSQLRSFHEEWRNSKKSLNESTSENIWQWNWYQITAFIILQIIIVVIVYKIFFSG